MTVTLEPGDVEFLVALGCHEEAFLYEILFDIAPRLHNRSAKDARVLAESTLQELMELGISEVGERSLRYEEMGSRFKGALPEAACEPSAWEWPVPVSSFRSVHWFASLTEKRIEGRGLEAVSPERMQELMFK